MNKLWARRRLEKWTEEERLSKLLMHVRKQVLGQAENETETFVLNCVDPEHSHSTGRGMKSSEISRLLERQGGYSLEWPRSMRHTDRCPFQTGTRPTRLRSATQKSGAGTSPTTRMLATVLVTTCVLSYVHGQKRLAKCPDSAQEHSCWTVK